MEKFVKNLKRGGLPTRCWLYMLILLLSFGLPASIFAQTDLVKVTGTVTDETNQPVPGVNVLLKGSSNIGTVTDIEGKYTLNIPKDATLIFKFVGYKTTEVAVNGKTTVNLSIQPDVKQLEDVVVIGYQAIKREKSTAAIASVAGEKIENIPVPSVEMALQGKVAGLNVLNITGEPGAKGIVTLRGNTSIASQDSRSTPLYVVDGVPTSDTKTINPSEIESITVLKDASSAAIYGNAGANGVVLITTKRGRKGEAQIELNAYYGFSERAKRIDVLNKDEYQDLLSDLGYPAMDTSVYNANIDWQDEMFRNAAMQNYQLSISGGNEKSLYYISAGFIKQDGIVKPSSFERMNFKINLEQELKKWVKIGTNLSYSKINDAWILPS